MSEMKLPQWPREQKREEATKADPLPVDDHRAKELEHLRRAKIVSHRILHAQHSKGRRKKEVAAKASDRKRAKIARLPVALQPFTGTYKEYISKSPQWKRKRKWAMRKLGKKCNRCGSTHNITVHHVSYRRLFNEQLEDLEILCRGCHANEHEGDKPWIVDPVTQRFLELSK